MFSGLIWTGADGIKLGLADDLGDARYVAETVIGAKRMVNFTPDQSLLDRLTHRFGASFGRALWNAMGAPLESR
jgi:protease-4